MKGTALVLAGGGGKGAYQIGAWKAIRELGMDQKITAVSGASVGGLNGALFAQGDYEAAERIWLSVSQDKILPPNKEALEKGEELRKENGMVSEAASVLLDGVFSRDGLISIMEQELDGRKISERQMPCYVSCHNIATNQTDYINITGMKQEDMETVLLATSALPGIFEPVAFGGQVYLDGGLSDNVPVKPLYQDGYRDFLVIHLGPHSLVDETQFPGAFLAQVVPERNQGDFLTGTLDFSSWGARRRIQEGYEEVKRFLTS